MKHQAVVVGVRPTIVLATFWNFQWQAGLNGGCFFALIGRALTVLHCNDSYFHSKWPFFQTWPNWLKKVNLFSFQSKWSGLKKMVILNENSCHCNAMQCNAMQCNASFMKGTSLVRIDPCLSRWNIQRETHRETEKSMLWFDEVLCFLKYRITL